MISLQFVAVHKHNSEHIVMFYVEMTKDETNPPQANWYLSNIGQWTSTGKSIFSGTENSSNMNKDSNLHKNVKANANANSAVNHTKIDVLMSNTPENTDIVEVKLQYKERFKLQPQLSSSINSLPPTLH